MRAAYVLHQAICISSASSRGKRIVLLLFVFHCTVHTVIGWLYSGGSAWTFTGLIWKMYMKRCTWLSLSEPCSPGAEENILILGMHEGCIALTWCESVKWPIERKSWRHFTRRNFPLAVMPRNERIPISCDTGSGLLALASTKQSGQKGTPAAVVLHEGRVHWRDATSSSLSKACILTVPR